MQGYMHRYYFQGHSISHTPDVDINFGVGNRIQLTYENAWLRVRVAGSQPEFWPWPIESGREVALYDAGEGHTFHIRVPASSS